MLLLRVYRLNEEFFFFVIYSKNKIGMPTEENENRLCSVRFLQPRLASSPLHVFRPVNSSNARHAVSKITSPIPIDGVRRAMPRSKTTNRRTRVGCVLGVFFAFSVATDLGDWCLKMSQVFSAYSIRHYKTIKTPFSYTGDTSSETANSFLARNLRLFRTPVYIIRKSAKYKLIAL